MRTKSAQAQAVIANPSHAARALVTVYSSAGVAGPTWGTGSAEGNPDPVLAVQVEQSIDTFRTARVTLRRQHGRWSLAPLAVSGNPLYTTEPPVAAARRIVIEAELVLPGISVTPSGLRETIFDGFIDEVSWPEDELLLVCTDKSAKLRDTWIERERVYGLATGAAATKGCIPWPQDAFAGTSLALALNDLVVPSDENRNGHFYRVTSITSPPGASEPTWPTGTGSTVASGGVTFTEVGTTSDTTGVPLETLIQQLLNDNGLGSFVTLQTPVSPGWNVKPYKQDRQSVADAIQAMVDQMGWWCRFEWSSTLGRYELTLAAPDRASATVHKTLLSDEEVTCSDLSVDVWSIRNVVRLIYSDSSSRDGDGNPLRFVREVSDSASIAKYGRRFMELGEASTSAIDTAAEADRMANAVLTDLREPTAGLGVEFPCDFYLEMGDRITVPADGLRFTAAQTLAVESLSHSFAGESARTSVTLRGAPAAHRLLWLSIDGRIDPEKMLHAVELFNSGSLGRSRTVTPLVGGARIAIAATRSKGALNQASEVHISPTSGFAVSGATMKGFVEGNSLSVADLVPGKAYYLRTVPVSRNPGRIVRGAPSAEQSFVAGRASAGHLDSQVIPVGPPNGKFQHALDNLASFPPDHWTLLTGTWADSDVFWGSTTTNGRHITFRGTAQGQLGSGAWPIPRGVSRAKLFATVRPVGTLSAGRNLQCHIDFFAEESLTTITGAVDLEVPYNIAAANVWADYAGDVDVPAGSNFARIIVYKTSASSAYGFDLAGVYFQPTVPRSLESWTLVNAAGGAAPAFATGWGNLGSGYQAVRFFKDPDGFVKVEGLANRTSGTGTTIFQLPAGYRPTAVRAFPCLANGAIAQVEVRTNGDVVQASGVGANPTNVSFEGIRFDTR